MGNAPIEPNILLLGIHTFVTFRECYCPSREVDILMLSAIQYTCMYIRKTL